MDSFGRRKRDVSERETAEDVFLTRKVRQVVAEDQARPPKDDINLKEMFRVSSSNNYERRACLTVA